jgi:hypothetical protein
VIEAIETEATAIGRGEIETGAIGTEVTDGIEAIGMAVVIEMVEVIGETTTGTERGAMTEGTIGATSVGTIGVRRGHVRPARLLARLRRIAWLWRAGRTSRR